MRSHILLRPRRLVRASAVVVAIALAMAPGSASRARPQKATQQELNEGLLARHLPPEVRALLPKLQGGITSIAMLTGDRVEIMRVGRVGGGDFPYRGRLRLVEVRTGDGDYLTGEIRFHRLERQNDSRQEHSWRFDLNSDSFSLGRRLATGQVTTGDQLGDFGEWNFDFDATKPLRTGGDECVSRTSRKGKIAGTIRFDFQNDYFGSLAARAGSAKVRREVFRTGGDCDGDGDGGGIGTTPCFQGYALTVGADGTSAGETASLTATMDSEGKVTQIGVRFVRQEPAFVSSFARATTTADHFQVDGAPNDVDSVTLRGALPFFGTTSTFETDSTSGPTTTSCGTLHSYTGSFSKGVATYWDGSQNQTYSANGQSTFASLTSQYP